MNWFWLIYSSFHEILFYEIASGRWRIFRWLFSVLKFAKSISIAFQYVQPGDICVWRLNAFNFILAYNLSDESDQMFYRSHLRRIGALPSINSLPSLPSIDFESSFDEFTSRTSKVIPIALALIKTQTTNVSDRLKFLFDFNWNWLPLFASTHNQLKHNIKTSLSPDEYNSMLNHINAYIETVVAEKLQKIQEKQNNEKIDPKLAMFIATIVKENIIEHKYVLSDGDVERIAEIVRLKLTKERDGDKAVPFVLSQENLEEISRIVKQNIEIHRHEWHSHSKVETNEAIQPAVDVDEILFKILTSSKLSEMFDQKIANRVDPIVLRVNTNQASTEQIRDDLELIKDKLASAFEANEETRHIVNGLKADQNDLGDQIHTLQNQQNEQHEKLLNEINLKVSTLSENKFDGIDEHIRSVLVEIIGFKSADGQPLQNGDITNWIRNVFVAKELLETHLNELNEKFEKKLASEINQSANLIIKDVSEKIKQEFLVLSEKQNSGDGRVHVSLDEQRIKDIIKEALAVYDADKTGMVDFALESSGGEVLSTR